MMAFKKQVIPQFSNGVNKLFCRGCSAIESRDGGVSIDELLFERERYDIFSKHFALLLLKSPEEIVYSLGIRYLAISVLSTIPQSYEKDVLFLYALLYISHAFMVL